VTTQLFWQQENKTTHLADLDHPGGCFGKRKSDHLDFLAAEDPDHLGVGHTKAERIYIRTHVIVKDHVNVELV